MKQPRPLQDIARLQVFNTVVEKCVEIKREAERSGDLSTSIKRTDELRADYLGCVPFSVLDDICELSNQFEVSPLHDDTYLYRVIMYPKLKTFRFLKSNESKPSATLLMTSYREAFWNSQLQLSNVVTLDISNILFTVSILETVSINCKLLEHLVIPSLGRTQGSPILDLGLKYLQNCHNIISLHDFYEFGDFQAMTVFYLVKCLKKLERINFRFMGAVITMFSCLQETLPVLTHFSQYNPNFTHINSLTSVCPHVHDVKMRDPDFPFWILALLKNSQLEIYTLELDSFPCTYAIFDMLQANPCAKLRSLKLLRCTNDFDRDTIRNIAESCPNIEVLHLSSGWILPMERGRVEVPPAWFNHLQDLLLRGLKCWDPEVFRMCLHNAHGIQAIKLDHIFNNGLEMSTYFLDIFKINPMQELKSLKLWQYRSGLTKEALLWLTTNCLQLTDLVLYCKLADTSDQDLQRLMKIVNVVMSNPAAQ